LASSPWIPNQCSVLQCPTTARQGTPRDAAPRRAGVRGADRTSAFSRIDDAGAVGGLLASKLMQSETHPNKSNLTGRELRDAAATMNGLAPVHGELSSSLCDLCVGPRVRNPSRYFHDRFCINSSPAPESTVEPRPRTLWPPSPFGRISISRLF
jgi:hypothetical protein